MESSFLKVKIIPSGVDLISSRHLLSLPVINVSIIQKGDLEALEVKLESSIIHTQSDNT